MIVKLNIGILLMMLSVLASLFGFVSSVILVLRGREYSPGMLVLDPCC